jgi:hypothetical protein
MTELPHDTPPSSRPDRYRLGWLGTAPRVWGSLFPQNAWESALPAACRPPQTGPPHTTGPMLCLFLSTPLLQSKSKISDHEFGTNDGEER